MSFMGDGWFHESGVFRVLWGNEILGLLGLIMGIYGLIMDNCGSCAVNLLSRISTVLVPDTRVACLQFNNQAEDVPCVRIFLLGGVGLRDTQIKGSHGYILYILRPKGVPTCRL